MKYFMIMFIAVIIFYLMYTRPKVNHVVELKKPDHSHTIRENLKKDKFVKPTHNLLYIFNQMSSFDKLRLNGDCKSSIFTRDTIPKNKDEYLKDVLNVIIEHIKHIDSEQDYNLHGVEQVYEQEDVHGNKRYIVIAFIYDVKNYYTIKVFMDFLRFKGTDVLYVNSIGNEFSSNYNVLNKYDFSLFSKGYLKDYNMFDKDANSILEENYRKYYKLIGINDSSIEYHLLDNVYKIDKSSFDKYDIDNYTKYYYSDRMPMERSGTFCQKHLNDWDEHGIKMENQFVPPECIANNNAAEKSLNRPYFGPGVITQRTDENDYSWLADPGRGNIIRSLGQPIN